MCCQPCWHLKYEWTTGGGTCLIAARVESRRATWPLIMTSLAPVGSPAPFTFSIASQLTGKSALGKPFSGKLG